MSSKKSLFSFPLSYEMSFLIIGLIFGIMFIRLNPPFHSNDEDRHFLKVYHMYESGLSDDISPDSTMIGCPIPVNLTQVVRSFQGVPYHMGKKLNKKIVEDRAKIPLNPNNKSFEHNNLYRNAPIPYFPHLIGLVIGKNFKDNPVFLGYAARFGGLIFYLIFMFFFIRTIPTFKAFFFLFGLTPMVLYQTSSVTYDLLNYTLSFSFLGIFLLFTYDEKYKIGPKMIITLILLAFLSKFTKNGYFIIPFVTLLIPNRKFDVKGNVLIYKVLLAIAYLVAYKDPFNMIWSSLFLDQFSSVKSNLKITMQKDFYKSFSERQSNFLAAPVHGFENLWLNLLHFKKEWLSGVFGRFGYSYSTLSNTYYIFHGVILILVAFLSNESKSSINISNKIIILLLGLLTAALTIVGFYFLSPVGANMIFGYQGRYLIPAIPLILFVLFNNNIKIEAWDKWGSTIVSVYALLMLTYVYSQMDNLFYEF